MRTGRGREGRRGERERKGWGGDEAGSPPPKLKLGPTRTIFLAPALSVTGHRN